MRYGTETGSMPGMQYKRKLIGAPQESITSSPSRHTLIDFPKSKMQQPMFTGFVQPTQPLNETSFFIDSDVEDTGSETGESFDEVEMSPVESSVESVRPRFHCSNVFAPAGG